MNLKNLKELGLSEGQISVYSATLDLGTSTLNSIHEKTGIERRNIYDILNKLIERGFISYTVENGKRAYQCTSPSNVLEEIKRKKEALDILEKETSKIMNMFNLSKPKIRAEVYRGDDALKALLEESLNYKESFWIGGNSEVYNTNLKAWFNHWMARRVEKRHMMYDLVDHGTWLDGLKPNDKAAHKKSHYQYCALPKNLASPLIIVIFGNKVAQVLWSKQPFAFVLESEEIKESFMKYFHYFWKKPK
ncbi:MAG: helix-turn-helix domain-containing protein [Nanoarchaeota archaeon]